MSDAPWLLAVDLQQVFGDPSSPWTAPRFSEAVKNVTRLASAFGDRTVFTRFVAPAQPVGAWKEYYAGYPWALQPPDSPLFRLTDDVAHLATTTVVAPTFGKWTADLRAVVGELPALVVAGVATDCCVLSTVLAAADAGADITVVTDACAGSDDDNHQRALDVMSLYGPLVTLSTTDEVLAASAAG